MEYDSILCIFLMILGHIFTRGITVASYQGGLWFDPHDCSWRDFQSCSVISVQMCEWLKLMVMILCMHVLQVILDSDLMPKLIFSTGQ